MTRELEIAHAMRAAEGTPWGIVIEDARAGHARISMVVRPDMLNGHGTCHGGMIFALADTAFAYACNGGNVATVAAAAHIVFLAPARAGEVLTATADARASEGRGGVYVVSVRAGDRAIAEFQGYSRTVGGAIIEEPS